MTATVKLYNKGERTITFDGGSLAPKKAGMLPAEIGSYLKNLYPDELQDMESVMQDFTNTPTAEVAAPAPVVEETKAEEVVTDPNAGNGTDGEETVEEKNKTFLGMNFGSK
jgi:hypothetical protein